MSVLVISDGVRARVTDLVERATATPVDVLAVVKQCATPEGRERHISFMTKYRTVVIPVGYYVTFSVDVGHPGGTARHVSISTGKPTARLPSPEAVEMIMTLLGFEGGVKDCDMVYPEATDDGGQCVNLIQFFEREHA